MEPTGKRHKRLNSQEIAELADDYVIRKMKTSQIAKKFNISRFGVVKILHRVGVDVCRELPPKVPCPHCGKLNKVNKGRANRQRMIFCNMDCFKAFQEDNTFSTRYLSRPVMELVRIQKMRAKEGK